jgi:hypothetical protein
MLQLQSLNENKNEIEKSGSNSSLLSKDAFRLRQLFAFKSLH